MTHNKPLNIPTKASSAFIAHCFGLGSQPIDMHKQNAKITDVTAKLQPETVSECNLWLPYAAECYELSKNIRDYVLVPVPTINTEMPNTNGDSVSLPEFLRFNPTLGMQSFKTFRGKPTHLEHSNKDIRKAKGVILDVYLRKIKNFGNGKYYKLVMLLAYDRTKDPILANAILSGVSNSYSVGYYYTSYSCPICKRRVGQDGTNTACRHINGKKPTYLDNDGRLVYRMCHNITGFECSSVEDPAFKIAVSDEVLDPRSY